MIRTQVYLTEHEKDELVALALQTGKKQSELIRDAVDFFIERFAPAKKDDILQKTAGMWKGREDMPKAEDLRGEWDREFK